MSFLGRWKSTVNQASALRVGVRKQVLKKRSKNETTTAIVCYSADKIEPILKPYFFVRR